MSRRSFRRSEYGKKGGTSVNVKKTATTYEAIAPDGTVFRKRSFRVKTDEAFIGIYEHEGKWYAAGVTDMEQDGHPIYDVGGMVCRNQTAAPAKRVSPHRFRATISL